MNVLNYAGKKYCLNNEPNQKEVASTGLFLGKLMNSE